MIFARRPKAWPSRGLYDLQANRGSVIVGTSHDTPDFAVDAICQWWRREGRRRYPQAPELLILADSGGSNGARCRAWKYALQEQLVDPYQLGVTVCHYPTGASKWNPVEHRLFSEISKHWAGQPLTDYRTIVRLIGETRTQTGLRVNCTLNTEYYPTKVQISDDQKFVAAEEAGFGEGHAHALLGAPVYDEEVKVAVVEGNGGARVFDDGAVLLALLGVSSWPWPPNRAGRCR